MGKPGYLFALCCAVVTLGALTACSGGSGGDEGASALALDEGVPMSIVVTSSVFLGGEAIPGKYTCYGLDQSPPISWTGVPEGAKSLA
ncbi:MAG: hypothetical protein IH956_07310, partial [Chloroflexi bacterium]|nr:hypothetical protein [Chloroflexota bacterium]